MKIPVFENEEELRVWSEELCDTYTHKIEYEDIKCRIDDANQRLEKHRKALEVRCPYCGDTAEIVPHKFKHHGYFCDCDNFECKATSPHKPTKAEAAAAWRKPKLEGPYIMSNRNITIRPSNIDVRLCEGDKIWIERAK